MSKVSRSTYQKCAEENKRLKKDIEALVMIDSKEETKEVFVRWREHFKSQRQFNALMRTVAKEYIREHKDELPDFLTRAVEEPSNEDAVLPLCGVSNLLPCPFCGEKAETVKSGDTYTTMCMNQECSVMVQSEGDDKEESESIWNVRAR